MYEHGENDFEVDMYIEQWQLEKDEIREANYNNHAWRKGYRVQEQRTNDT